MQMTSKFTIAIHMIVAIDYFQNSEIVTSSFLAGSVGVNPVIVRNVMGDLKNAGILEISRGKSGMELAREPEDITFYDVYKAVDCVGGEGLFHFHEQPNADCPVGRNIHKALDDKLTEIQRAMEEQMRAVKLSDIVNKIQGEIKKEAKHR